MTCLVMPSPTLGRPSEFDRLNSYVRRHKIAVVVVLVVVVVILPLVIYFELSYNSVNGTTIELASVKRTVNTSFFGGISSVTYSLEAHVWSYATYLDTRVSNPSFFLVVDSNPIGSQSGGGGTFKPYTYLIYYLTFTTLDSGTAQAIGSHSTNNVAISMDGMVSAGMYSEYETLGASRTFSF